MELIYWEGESVQKENIEAVGRAQTSCLDESNSCLKKCQ